MNLISLSKPIFLWFIGLLFLFVMILQLNEQFNEEDFNFQMAEISSAEQLQIRDLNTQLALKKSNLKQSSSDLSASNDNPQKSVTLPQVATGGLLVLSNTQEQLFFNVDLDDSSSRHWPMISPLMESHVNDYPISSHFGYRLDPIHHLPSMHQGVDFLAPIGTPIVATADGVIIKAGHVDSYGLLLEIQHANGFKSKYAHTSLIQVKLGDQVKQGQLIAYVGNSGRSTGAHLHYEVLMSNKPIDPIRLLR